MSGVHSAAVAVTLDYANLRNPRPITAPSGAQPIASSRPLDRLGLGLGGAVSGSRQLDRVDLVAPPAAPRRVYEHAR